MSIELCRALGAAKIIAVDISPYRLKLAEKFKPDHIVNGNEPDTHGEIMDITQGEGVDILLEMSGSPSAFREGLKLVKTAGFASLLGIPRDEIKFDIANLVIMKGISLYGIAGRKMYETWYQMKGLLDSKRIDISPVITHRMKLDDFEKGIELMSEGQCGKIVMTL
jgi:threonine 3-dehydrogenase